MNDEITIPTLFEKELERLATKFPKLSDTELEIAVEDSMVIYFRLRNMKEFDEDELTYFARNWITRCSQEILNRGDYVNIESYSENGYSIQYLTSNISQALLDEVTPKVAIPKSEESNG